MIRGNLVKRINLLRQKRNFSSSSDDLIEMPFDLKPITKKQYVKGAGMSLLLISGYSYYSNMTEERNKYKPYSTFIRSMIVGGLISIFWPLTVPIYTGCNVLLESMDLTLSLDKEYEKKKKEEEEKMNIKKNE